MYLLTLFHPANPRTPPRNPLIRYITPLPKAPIIFTNLHFTAQIFSVPALQKCRVIDTFSTTVHWISRPITRNPKSPATSDNQSVASPAPLHSPTSGPKVSGQRHFLPYGHALMDHEIHSRCPQPTSGPTVVGRIFRCRLRSTPPPHLSSPFQKCRGNDSFSSPRTCSAPTPTSHPFVPQE